MDLMQQIKRNFNIKTIFFAVGLVALTAIMFVFERSLYSSNLTIFYYIATIVVAVCMMVYVFIFGHKIFSTPNRTLFVAAMMIISTLFTIAGNLLFDVPLWAIGAVLIAGLIDRDFGFISALFFILQIVPIMSNRVLCAVFCIVIVALICFLIDKVTSIKTMLYLMVITAAVALSLSLILNRLLLPEAVKLFSARIIITYISIIAVEHLVYMFYGKFLGTEKKEVAKNGSFDYLNQVAVDTAESFEFIENLEKRELEAEETRVTEEMLSKAIDELGEEPTVTLKEVLEDTVKDAVEQIKEDIKELEPEKAIPVETEEPVVEEPVTEEPAAPKDYSIYCDLDSELLKSFKDNKKSAFVSARKIAKFSEISAEQIGLNVSLVQSLALLSKIGKMMDGNLAQDTHDLLLMYEVDEDIIKGCDELNGFEDMTISTKEAGLVALTDTVISSYTFMKQMKKAIVPVRFVDMTLGQVSVSGKISESGLTLSDLSTIRNCYVEQISNLEK